MNLIQGQGSGEGGSLQFEQQELVCTIFRSNVLPVQRQSEMVTSSLHGLLSQFKSIVN